MPEGFLEPNEDFDAPTKKDIAAFWRELEVTHVQLDHSAVGLLLMELLETHAKVAFGCFELSDHPVLEWFGSRNRLDEFDFVRTLLSNSVIRETLPGLEIPKKVPSLDATWGTSFILDGTLAQVLVNGGAEFAFSGTDSEAKDMCLNFCDALFEGRYSENLLYDSFDAWTPWFSGNPNYDHTWFCVDKRLSRFWLLAITDDDAEEDSEDD